MVNELLSKPDLCAFRKVLCIQPHPDDNEVAAGGTIARLCAGGAEVQYLTVTDGRYGCSKPEDVQRTPAIRRAETVCAGESLGVRNFRFLEHSDWGLPPVRVLMEEIMAVIRDVRPELVVCPDPWLMYESHEDHIVTGLAAVRACGAAGSFLGGGPRWGVQAIAMYYTARPNVYIDVSDTFDQKLTAVCCHKSQFSGDSAELVRDYLTYHMSRRGAEIGSRYAEGFKILPMHALHAIPEAENL